MQRLRILFAVILLAGAVFWNGWVFGFFNHGLAGYLHMSISELQVVGQPHVGLFNFLENISGICMIIGALGLIAVANRKLNIALLILISVAAVGALTLYDVAYPLECNSYNNRVCRAQDNNDKVSHTNVLHDDESRITTYVTIFLVVVVAIWSHFIKLRRSELSALITIAVGVIITLAILDINGNATVNAISERVWNVLVSIAISYVSWKFISSKHYHRHAASRI